MKSRYLILFAAIVLWTGCSTKPDVTINLIETTDIHGSFFSYNFITNQPANNSLSRISAYVDSMRHSPGSNVVLLDNGDLLQGQPVIYYSNFIDTAGINLGAAVLNYLKYDVAVPGNHDIECGHAVFDKVARQLDCPYVAANEVYASSKEPYFKPYTIINRGGARIAVLGLVTPGIPNWVPYKLWEGMAFDDMIESARKWVAIIQQKEHPDLIIGLFHSGVDPKYNNQTDTTYKNENAVRLVAEQVPGFAAVFSGHDHKPFNGFTINSAGDTVLILNGGYHANSLAQLTLNLKYNKSLEKYQVIRSVPKLVYVDKHAIDTVFENYFEANIENTRRFTSKIIGTISKPITTQSAYFGSNAFIDLIHRVQLSASGAQISFAAPLSFNASIKAGELTVADLFQLYKYENLLYVLNLKGIEIDRYLEFTAGLWFNQMRKIDDHLLNLTQDEKGNYRLANQYYNLCSTAGIEYLVDVSKPVGKRVQILGMSDGTPFFADSVYRVAMNSYRGSGGGGHLAAAGLTEKDIKERLVWSSTEDIRRLLMKYIETEKVINPTTFDNWRIIPEDYHLAGSKRDSHLIFNENK